MGDKVKKRLKPRGDDQREKDRLRQEKHRAKLEAENELRDQTEETLTDLRKAGFTMFGELETSPNGYPIDAQTAEEELLLASEYAAALGLPGIRPGQTIRNYIDVVLREHCRQGAKMFNRGTGQFAPDKFEGLDASEYTYVDGVDEAPIQIETEIQTQEVTNE